MFMLYPYKNIIEIVKLFDIRRTNTSLTLGEIDAELFLQHNRKI